MNKYVCAGKADIGCERESQEDFIQCKELGAEGLFCIVADGTGSRKEHPQPASMVAMEITNYIYELYQEKPQLLNAEPQYFVEQAIKCANRILGAFKIGNEELFSGYATSITCCLLLKDERMIVGHSGNTRLYLLRNGNLKQLTLDHTKAMKLLNEGTIDIETYHVHPDRLKMTSGIGVIVDPEIQILSGKIKDNDILVMTTDGIHYAIQQHAIADIILKSTDCENAATNLIDAAKNIIKYPDNMSVMIIHKS